MGTESVRLPGSEPEPLGLGRGTMTVSEPGRPVGCAEVCAGGVYILEGPDAPVGNEVGMESVPVIDREGSGEIRLTEKSIDCEGPVG